SVPLVAITGNVTTQLLGKDSFQEVDITGITMPITKHNFIVKDVADLAKTVRKAFLIAQEGRQGPVLIDVPKDVTVHTADFVPQVPEKLAPRTGR
ncbi:MAG: thiamine pyrophosphate-binding protein, partial [Sphaerochaeta sp.]|nr:thiamine pyrophosphate-binding protein [Sphaerochaeta sp.]